MAAATAYHLNLCKINYLPGRFIFRTNDALPNIALTLHIFKIVEGNGRARQRELQIQKPVI